MGRKSLGFCAIVVGLVLGPKCFAADEVPAALPTLKVPEGFSVELAAGSPLVERPIVAAFDEQGRLYVAESSGSNDPVQKQLAEKPHRILRLEDTDGDGKFDRRTVFADHMMFPEGAMFLNGSLYVSAPPSIWKLTDTDGDGVADERVEWFQGKTLTGCANDLHGPYAGPDGWIYWCKGAFARADAYRERARMEDEGIAHFSLPAGWQRFRTGDDWRDGQPGRCRVYAGWGADISRGRFSPSIRGTMGLIHAIYGGVYGKENGVLAGHPRTGELMPIAGDVEPGSVLAGWNGMNRSFGAEYRDNLFLCQFNLRKVSRHVLKPPGSTYTSDDSDFVWSDFVDFHPTDVVVDADGSLLVVDTGGWYKLCCPTSQLVEAGCCRGHLSGAAERSGDGRRSARA